MSFTPGQATPMTVVYSEIVDVNVNPNKINLVDVDYGHRIQVQIPATILNDTFRWSRASGERVPSVYISETGLNLVLNELKNYVATFGFDDLDAANLLNYNNTELNAKVRTMTTNDLVVAYILYKLYNDSTYDLSGTTFNPEDLKSMLDNATFLDGIKSSLMGANQQVLNSMLNELLVSDPMRFFDETTGLQIPGLFETADSFTGEAKSGSFMLANDDIIEIRVRMQFQSQIQRTSLDSGSGYDKIVSGDKFMVRLQLLATGNTPTPDPALNQLTTITDSTEAQTAVTSYITDNLYLGTTAVLTSLLAVANQNNDPAVQDAIKQQVRTEIINNSTDVEPIGTNAYTLTLSAASAKSALVNALVASDPSYDNTQSIQVIIPDYSSGTPSVPVSTTGYNYIMLLDGESITLTNGADSIEATYSSADPAHLTVDGVDYALGDSIPIGASSMKVLGFGSALLGNPAAPPPQPFSFRYMIGGGWNNDMNESAIHSTDGLTWSNSSNLDSLNIQGILTGATNGSNIIVGYKGQDYFDYQDILYTTDGVNWSNAVSGSPINYVDNIIYCNGKFFIMGSYNDYDTGNVTGVLQYSTDGSNWSKTGITGLGNTNEIINIAYGNNKYLLSALDVDFNPVYYTSSDGLHWTLVDYAPGYYFVTFVYGNGMWIGVDQYGDIYYSNDDGATWNFTHSTINSYTSYYKILAYGNGMFVLLSTDENNTTYFTSEDGITWNENYMSGQEYPSAITFDGIQFVAAGPTYNNGTKGAVWFSSDGITFTVLNETLNTSAFCILHNDGFSDALTGPTPPAPGASRYIASGMYNNGITTSSKVIQTSTDGSSWTALTTPLNTNEISKITTNGSNVYLAYDQYNYVWFLSTDGQSWGQTEIPSNPTSIKYVNGTFYTTYAYDPQSSTDGSNWSSCVASGDLFQINAIAYGNGKYLVTGYDSSWQSKLYTSTDGSNWTTLISSFDYVNTLAYNNGVWVRDGDGGSSTYYSTNDGSNWSLVIGDTFGALDLAYGNGTWVASGSSSYSNYVSTDGSNWTAAPAFAPTVNGSAQVIFDGTKFIGRGNVAKYDRVHMIQTSTDGSNWTQTADNTGLYEINTISFANGVYVIGGYEESTDYIQTSTDINIWTGATSLNGIDGWMTSFATNGSNLYVGAMNNDSVCVSTDSSNWKAILPTVSGVSYLNVAYLNGAVYACGNAFVEGQSIHTIVSSTDGSNWTAVGPTDAFGVYYIGYSDGLYVAVGMDTNYILVSWTSTDGSNWTLNGDYFGEYMNFITYANGVWMGCGYGSVYTSTDGVTWDYTSALGDTIAYGNGVWVSAANDTFYSYSTDNGATWNEGSYLPNSIMKTVHFDGSIFVAGGNANDNNATKLIQISEDGIKWWPTSNQHNFNTVYTITSIQ